MRITCPDCDRGGAWCVSCEGWGQIDVYQADADTMRLPGTWSNERERANERRRERKRGQRRADYKRQLAADIRYKQAVDDGLMLGPVPVTFLHLMHTQDQMRDELARRHLLRATGVPVDEWHRCLTLDEAVVYCQAYNDENEEGVT